MNSISNEDIKLLDNVVIIRNDGARSYSRTSRETFALIYDLQLDGMKPVDVVRESAESFVNGQPFDVIIEHQATVDQMALLDRSFGWTISDDNGVINIIINDFFCMHTFTLRIERDTVLQVAQLLCNAGYPNTRIFLAMPSTAFRYCVLFPSDINVQSGDLLENARVNFCAHLPKFTNDVVGNIQGTALLDNSLDGLTMGRHESSSLTSVAADQDMTNPLVDGQIHSLRPTVDLSVSIENEILPIKEFYVCAEDYRFNLESSGYSVYFLSDCYGGCPSEIQPQEEDEILCFMLDGGAKTSLAVVEFIQQYATTFNVFEVGLWRRRLKSLVGKSLHIMDTFEFTKLPISDYEYGLFSDFVKIEHHYEKSDKSCFVFGDELVNDEMIAEIVYLLGKGRSLRKVVIFSENISILNEKLVSISAALDTSSDCVIALKNFPENG